MQDIICYYHAVDLSVDLKRNSFFAPEVVEDLEEQLFDALGARASLCQGTVERRCQVTDSFGSTEEHQRKLLLVTSSYLIKIIQSRYNRDIIV